MSGGLGEYAHLLRRALPEARLRALGDPVANAAARRAEEQLSTYASRPVEFVHDVLGQVTWQAQRSALRALCDRHLVLNCGCRKSGKSRVSAFCATWMTATAPTRCIVTASSYQQVRNNLFAWIRKLKAGSRVPLPGRLGVASWRMDDPTWHAIGISVDRPDNMQGVHADVDLPEHYKFDGPPAEHELPAPDPRLEDQDLRRAERDPGDVIGEELFNARRSTSRARILFVMDEMAGMRADIIETILGSLMGDRAFAIGQFNPTFSPDSGHPAARFMRPGSGWWRIHTAAREPNEEHHGPPAGEAESMFDECFHSPPREMIPLDWVEKQVQDWGEGTAMTLAHIDGLPSNVERERQIIPFRIIKPRLDVAIPDDGRAESRHIGWDVAGSEGGDFTVVQLWVCGLLTEEVQWRIADTSESLRRVLELAQKWGANGKPIPDRNIHVDATGGSLGKALWYEARKGGHYLDGVDFGGAPEGDWQRLVGAETYFKNRKAELHWIFRCVLQKGLASIPRRFRDTIQQAQWPTYKEVPHASGMAIKVAEDKDELRKLYGRSPDNLEAAILAWSRSSRAPQVYATSDIRKLRRRLRTN